MHQIYWLLVLIYLPNDMTVAEKIEFVLVPIFGAGIWLMAPGLPDKVGIGNLLLGVSALLLFQGLVRDLWLLTRKKRAAHPGPLRKSRCLCVESTVGATGIIAGIVLLGSRIDLSMVMNAWVWSFLVMVTMSIGIVIKNYVVEWGPLRVRQDKYPPQYRPEICEIIGEIIGDRLEWH